MSAAAAAERLCGVFQFCLVSLRPQWCNHQLVTPTSSAALPVSLPPIASVCAHGLQRGGRAGPAVPSQPLPGSVQYPELHVRGGAG